MREPIENEYFNWLCAKVVDNPRSRMYNELLRILYKTEFVWFVAGDRNRAEDGCELRQDFLRQSTWERDPLWYNEPCSILEMLIAFSDRAYFNTDRPAHEWFWEMLTNLGLNEYRVVSDADVPVIEDILNTFVWRTYDPSGLGGIFPMRSPKHDQRKVEIWYQFCEYLDDQGLI